jgi:DYW family of nucleic acid deaminases
VPGYSSDVSNQVSRVEEREERKMVLRVHSEKFTVCSGLLSTKSGSPVRIFKNLRICSDCHKVMKLILHLYER